YLVMRRKYPLTLLRVFDQPTIATNCTRRDASAVPLQSLTMLNDPFVLEQAEQFAVRVARTAGEARTRRLELAFRLALARAPSTTEAEWCADHLEKQAALYRAAKSSTDQAELKALTSLCHALLNTSEFLYADASGKDDRTSSFGPGGRP